jgi:hypothetical protein
MTIRKNSLDQSLDISGSKSQSQFKTLSDESSKYGQATGQSGLLASITVGANIVLTGLTGITANSVGNFLQISGAANSNNNGIFKIITFNSSSSVNIENSSAATDANNGSIIWTERSPYTLEDDINFIRTDRKLIKGTTNYYDSIPQYVRPDDTLVDVDTNLTNISGKTLDAHAWIEPRFKKQITVNIGDTYIVISELNNLKHADSVDITGIPVIDGYDSNNYRGCFVEIVDGYLGDEISGSSLPIPTQEGQVLFSVTSEEFSVATPLTADAGWLVNDDGILLVAEVETETTVSTGSTDGLNLRVLDGYQSGEKIFGLATAGSSLSPNSIEIHFYSMSVIDWNFSSITPYIWEDGQPNIINISYGYRQRLDLFNENSIREILIQGALSGAGSSVIASNEHKSLHHLIHFIDDGPAEGFTSGAFKETIGGVFPSQIIWWTNSNKISKIVELNITRDSSQKPTIEEWKMYDTNSSIIEMTTDIIVYFGIAESTRVRTIA